MPDTSRRVFVGLTAATDEPAHHVMTGLLTAVRNVFPALAIEVTSAHVIGEDDEPETLVQFVVSPGYGLLGAYTDDPERADEHARNINGLVVELPAVADYRPGATT